MRSMRSAPAMPSVASMAGKVAPTARLEPQFRLVQKACGTGGSTLIDGSLDSSALAIARAHTAQIRTHTPYTAKWRPHSDHPHKVTPTWAVPMIS